MSDKKGQYLNFLDAVRVILCIGVIVVHSGAPYSDGGWWWWMQSKDKPTVNPNYFFIAFAIMCTFFIISGYLMPKSVLKKGGKQFMKQRLIRFGLPLLTGLLIIFPVLLYFYHINFRDYGHISFSQYYSQIYFGMGRMPKNWTGQSWPDMQWGHLWYLEHILLYDAIFILITWALNKSRLHDLIPKICSSKTALYILLSLTLIGTFIVRIKYPLITWGSMLWIVQTLFSNFFIWLASYLLGIAAAYNDWILKISSRKGYFLFWQGIILNILFIAGGKNSYIFMWNGGVNVQSFIRCIFDMLTWLGLSIGFIILCREKFNQPRKLLKKYAPRTFTIYVIHFPIVIGTQYAMEYVSISPAMRFFMVSVVSVLLTFMLAGIIRKIPVVRYLLGY